MHGCEKEREWGKLDEKVERFDKHIEESDKAGGVRDRVTNIERDIFELEAKIDNEAIDREKEDKQTRFLIKLGIYGSLIAAAIGSLIGQAIPILGKIIEFLLKHCGFNFK